MASDGTVYTSLFGFSYSPKNDSTFRQWADWAGNGKRDNEGWQVYQQVDGRTVRSNTGVKRATITQMHDLINQHRRKQTSE